MDPQWRFLCLSIFWNENPTTYANYFVTPRFKPTMWTHFFLGKTKSPPKKFDTYKTQKRPQQIYLIRNKSCTTLYKTWKKWGKLPISWCDIFSINGILLFFGEGFMLSRSNVLWGFQKFSSARYRTSRGVIFHTSGRGREIFSDLHVGVNLNEKSNHV